MLLLSVGLRRLGQGQRCGILLHQLGAPGLQGSDIRALFKTCLVVDSRRCVVLSGNMDQVTAAGVMVGLGAMILVAACSACSRSPPPPTPTNMDVGRVQAVPAAPARSATASAPPAATSTAVRGQFIRRGTAYGEGVDSCAFLGGNGFACLHALLAEPDQVKRRYMRRLSDAYARLEIEVRKTGAWDGPPHIELALQCKLTEPCSRGGDGYACLTAAEASLRAKDFAVSRREHAQACRCSPERAQIPVMGGVLACDGPGKPVERGKDLSLGEAREIIACATCDAQVGPAACAAEIVRLKSTDAAIAGYLDTTHVPGCQVE